MNMQLSGHDEYLINLKNACNAGLVNINKTEWDAMPYADCLFLILHEVEMRKKSQEEMEREQQRMRSKY